MRILRLSPMNNTAIPPVISPTQKASGHGLLRYLKLIFISGPTILLTSQISVKCATVMILMCIPALFFSAMLTLPELVFQSPQQNAYFYFAQVLEQDPTRWIVLILAGLCALLSLALPATMECPRDSVSY